MVRATTFAHRILLHLLMQSSALIACILICVIFLDAVARHLIDRAKLDQGRVKTLHIIFKLGIQFLGALIILFVIFGAPSEMPTIVGLTTAGLTLVLQDFIIAFFGWFVLMGKHGIRIGDWVEINGVAGEVAEISVFRTSMLEMGNWTDQGIRRAAVSVSSTASPSRASILTFRLRASGCGIRSRSPSPRRKKATR